MALVQTLSHLKFFLFLLLFFFFFFWKDLGNLIFFWDFKKKKKYIYIYIHEQSTSNATWIFRIQRSIET